MPGNSLGSRSKPAAEQLSLHDRVALIRAVLHPYPAPAETSVRQLFDALVERLGTDAVFSYLRERQLVSAALATHGTSAHIIDPSSAFPVFGHVSRVLSGLHRMELGRLAASFEATGVPLIAFKGVALEAALGNTNAPAYSNDIDVLVPRGRLPQAREALCALGYSSELWIRAGQVSRMPSRVVEMSENSLYSFGQCAPMGRLVAVPELAPMSRQLLELFPHLFCFADDRFQLKLSVDLHYSLNQLTDDVGTRVKPSEGVWLDDTEKVDIDGVTVATLSHRVLSWVLPHRLYVDAALLQEASAKSLCHLKSLWHHGTLDTEHVRDVALRYPYLAPSLYYALRAMDQLCGTSAQPLIEPVRIRQSATPLMNVGDCLPALLGFAVEVTLGEPAGPDTGDTGIALRPV